MARTRTLTQLRSEIRDRGDLRSVRHTDDMLTRNVNQSIAELYDLLVSVSPDYFLSSDDISVSSGTANYALVSDFYKCVGVDVQDSSNWHSLRRFNFAERNQMQQGGGVEKTGTRYRVMGSNLRLRPTPNWTGTVRLWYIPAPSVLSEDTDTFDGVSGWEEYVIVDCILKAKVRDEEDIQEVMAQKQILVGRIQELAAERDVSEPDRIRDVESERNFEYDIWNR